VGKIYNFILSAIELTKIYEHNHKTFKTALKIIQLPGKILEEMLCNIDLITEKYLYQFSERKETQMLRFIRREYERLNKREIRLKKQL